LKRFGHKRSRQPQPPDPGLLPEAEAVPGGVRLQKILSQSGIASRREAEEWIREGKVFVNGRVARLGDRADPDRDSIRVGTKRVRPRTGPSTYILLNKPRGYVTTVSDPERRDTVLDLLPGGLRRGVRPVGRVLLKKVGLIVL
jgi:23S rRNA pseudouridine2605 synthase